jgi:hypothetical protein
VRVELTEPTPSPLQSLRLLLHPLVAPISLAAVKTITIAAMLMGQRQLNLATQAFDDAAGRVSRYLRHANRCQHDLRRAHGAWLYFIGVPSAVLWGVLAGILRFVPYIGPIIGGTLPPILTWAVFQTWLQLILCLCLFLVVELTVAYVIEPWLYGTSIRISSLLTVCLVVLGRYVPHLEFLHIILGDEPVLSSEAQSYQRLLAMDQREASSVIDVFLRFGRWSSFTTRS